VIPESRALSQEAYGMNNKEIKGTPFLRLHSKIGGRLVLVGTVHRDPQGFAKLSRLLEMESPAILTVEFSPYGRTFRARNAGALRSRLRTNLRKIAAEQGREIRKNLAHPAIQSLFALLQEPYEWRAAKAYARREGVELWDIDLSTYSRQRLAHVGELITEENLRALLGAPSDPRTQIESQYNRARFLWAHPPAVDLDSHGEEERDLHMAGRIRGILENRMGKKLIHVGGWEHLIELPDRKTLFTLLADLQPRRVILPGLEN
jgi:hypothetical protein